MYLAQCSRLLANMLLFVLQMIKEFCQLTGAVESSFMAKWIEFETAVFKYAPLEEKRAVKSVMTEYKRYTSESSGKCIWWYSFLPVLYIS